MNPYNRNIEDCVIRSLSLLTGRSWDETYRELAYYASLDGYMTDNVDFVEDYLEKYARSDKVKRYLQKKGIYFCNECRFVI
jgi:hypothetical protein